MPKTIKTVGTINVRGTEWRLFEYYPQAPRHDYKFMRAVPVKRPQDGITFALEIDFERWLEQQQAPGQRASR
jgi:hypothetical protein